MLIKETSYDLTFNEYSKTAWETAVYPQRGTCSFASLAYCVLGLSGETGEIAEKIKKVFRDKGGVFDNETKTLLIKEIGDVQWYLNALAIELGSSLNEAAKLNSQKLLDRQARGVLGGSGDTR